MLLSSFSPAVFFLLALCEFSLGQPAAPVPSSTPLPPSKDPFYTAPQNWQSVPPGAVLRSRIAPGDLLTAFDNASTVYNIVYRTTDAHYLPSWAFTTLFVPKTSNAQALLSYQIPYNTADVDASASQLLYSPPAALGLILSDIQAALSQGWYVNVPDFEGPLASFGLGVQEGHATIDSIRAALSKDFGLAGHARYAMWGYSGGSLASEWAAELAEQYAPELKFAGAALGGLVSNVSDVLPAVSGSPFAGLVPEMLLGVTSQYPEARRYLLSQLKPDGQYNKTTFLAAENMGIEEAFAYYANRSAYAWFKNGKIFYNAPPLQEIFNQQGYMGYHGVPQMPLFVYKAVADEVTSIGSTDQLVQRYCGVGANIVYERNTIGGHLAEETNGDQSALEWLAKVLGGEYKHIGCTVKDVAINVTNSPL